MPLLPDCSLFCLETQANATGYEMNPYLLFFLPPTRFKCLESTIKCILSRRTTIGQHHLMEVAFWYNYDRPVVDIEGENVLNLGFVPN